MRKTFIIIGLAFLSGACSQFSNAPTSVAWHNTNARFNSLIIARENMKVAEKALFEGRNDVYSQLLPILLPIDSTFSSKGSSSSSAFGGNPIGGFGNNNSQGNGGGVLSQLGNNLQNNLQNSGNSNSLNSGQNTNGLNSGLNNGMNSSSNGLNSGLNNSSNGLNNTSPNGLNNSSPNGMSNSLNQAANSIGLPIASGDVKANFEEVIKKTSMIAERHSNSKYLDEAYLLLGKARLYKGDYLNAIEIFKYINTKGTREEQKHAALIWLMRAYIEQKDYETALKVSETLRLLDLNKQNTIDFYLTKAYLHQLRGEYNVSAAIAEEALPLMKKGDMKARVHYATGEMYDLMGKPAEAAVHYAAIAKLHPNYDLEFYSRMNVLLDESAARQTNLDNDFKKMLADRKNKDLKDKIYYTMGSIEEKKENYLKAIEYYQLSIKNSSGVGQQKAYTYLQLAELHYDKLAKYEAANAYYDSCLTVLPKNSTDYERIYKRAISLNNFVKYTNTIKMEDSLQRLASMNPMALDKLLDKVITDKQEEEKKLLEMAKKIAEQANRPTGEFIGDGEDGFKRWEMYDPVMVARGKTDFIQQWGNRTNEDNWRRKDKEAGSISFKIERGVIDPNAPKSNIRTVKKGEEVPLSKEELAKNLETQKKEMLDKIPTTPEKLAESNKKVEEAYYQLGKIYKLQFNEPDNAKRTFETLLAKYPTTQHEPEVLYFLTLLSDNQAISPYRTGLLAKYPSSTYARQLLRGNVNITSDMEAQANQIYNRIFNLYSQGVFEMALKEADDGLIKFTGTTIEDKFAMIRILLLAKNEQKEQYTQALKEFTQSYPNSNLMKRAKEMLAVVDKK